MCGRTCMTLSPEEVVCACKYKLKDDAKEGVKPEYRREFNLGREYKPSYNLPPSLLAPIIVSSKHFDDNADSAERTIIPALWGLIPRWHKGDYSKHEYTTNNARLESIEHSKMYKPLLTGGKRCVLVVEGFYEWKTTDPKLKSSERPVFYVYMPQENEKIHLEDKSTWSCEDVKLLHVAGLYDIWHDENGDSIYSFTIITHQSDDHFSWLHERVPAILETEEQVRDWLDYERVPHNRALKLITQPKNLKWHEVSHYVNSTRNSSDLCNKRLDDVKNKGSVMNWVKGSVMSPRKETKSPSPLRKSASPGKSPKRAKKE